MLKGVPSSLAPKTAARTALPQPPNTSQNVPMNSATQLLRNCTGHLFSPFDVLPNVIARQRCDAEWDWLRQRVRRWFLDDPRQQRIEYHAADRAGHEIAE